jgi:hypothetical protein
MKKMSYYVCDHRGQNVNLGNMPYLISDFDSLDSLIVFLSEFKYKADFIEFLKANKLINGNCTVNSDFFLKNSHQRVIINLDYFFDIRNMGLLDIENPNKLIDFYINNMLDSRLIKMLLKKYGIISPINNVAGYLENDPGCSNINMIASIYKSFIKKQIINPNTGKIYLSNMLSLAQIAYLFNRQINSMPFKDYQQQKATYLQEHQFKDKDGLIYNNDLFSEATSKKETLDAEDSAIINPDISASEMEYVNEAEEAFLDKHAYKHY